MPRTRTAYPLEFRQQMIELVHAGRTAEELSREFEGDVPFSVEKGEAGITGW